MFDRCITKCQTSMEVYSYSALNKLATNKTHLKQVSTALTVSKLQVPALVQYTCPAPALMYTAVSSRSHVQSTPRTAAVILPFSLQQIHPIEAAQPSHALQCDLVREHPQTVDQLERHITMHNKRHRRHHRQPIVFASGLCCLGSCHAYTILFTCHSCALHYCCTCGRTACPFDTVISACMPIR